MESKQEFPMYYNVKMLAPGQGANTVNLAQIEDNKTIQYIAQPFTTSYGQSYTLVNPLQIAGQNGQQIVINKPISSVSHAAEIIFVQNSLRPASFRTRFPTLASNVMCAVKSSPISRC